MPELPEVEIIKLGLEKKITGLKLKTIEVLNPKTLQGDSKLVIGQNVLNVWRKAKVLGINLTGNYSLIFHLKMSGQIIWDKGEELGITGRFVGGHPTKDMTGELPNKSTRVIFTFSDNSKLYFNDQRKFGWVKVVKSDELNLQSLLSTLGPEPLEKAFTWEILKTNLLKHKSMPVKVAILDQKVVSGIGNIYASEATFLAGIDPSKKVKDLSDENFKKLHAGIVESLKNGIKYGGSSKTHFVNAEGKKGYFLDYAYVYGKTGDKCKKCGSVIKKIQLGGRGTYFCEKCQK